jgi:hypothetical protein
MKHEPESQDERAESGDAMRGVRLRTEVALNVPNDLDVLAKLFANLGIQSRDIDAWRFYSDHKRAVILLVTRNGEQVVRSFQDDGFACDTNPVVVLEEHHRTISAIRLSAHLRANGVEILDAYSCCTPHNGTALVLRTSDVSRTTQVLGAMDRLWAQPTSSFCISDTVAEVVEPARLN